MDWLLESLPQARHLFITCNRDGALATSYRHRPEVRTVVLDEKTDDRSLVMTSSFTNLVLAGRALGGNPEACEARALGLARAAAAVLRERAEALDATARSGFGSVVYLGSGCRLGSAHEAALKMLEMNAGEVFTFAESCLGLRHGPMSAIRPDTLVVALLSSVPGQGVRDHGAGRIAGITQPTVFDADILLPRPELRFLSSRRTRGSPSTTCPTSRRQEKEPVAP